jgi:hypothetical protein
LAGASEAQYTYQCLGRKGSRHSDDDCFCRWCLPPCEQAAPHGTKRPCTGRNGSGQRQLSP